VSVYDIRRIDKNISSFSPHCWNRYVILHSNHYRTQRTGYWSIWQSAIIYAKELSQQSNILDRQWRKDWNTPKIFK